MSERWLSVGTRAGDEFYAEWDLARRGFQVFAPWQMRERPAARGVRSEKVARFAGYIFVRVDEAHSVWELRRAFGVVSVATRDGLVLAVSQRVMDKMRAACTWDGYWPPVPSEAPVAAYRAGDVVMLSDGPFSGFPGEIERVDGHRQIMIVSVLIFGRSTTVECPLSWATERKPAKAG